MIVVQPSLAASSNADKCNNIYTWEVFGLLKKKPDHEQEIAGAAFLAALISLSVLQRGNKEWQDKRQRVEQPTRNKEKKLRTLF